MKIAITAIITCILTLLVAGGLWAYRSAHSNADPATPVRIESPVRGDLVELVSSPGEVEPMTKVSISARVSARVVELPYREGKLVTKGIPDARTPVPPSVLVRLDDTDLKADLNSAQSRRSAQAAQIEVSKARLVTQQAVIAGVQAAHDDALRSLERVKQLFSKQISSQADLDQAQCAVDKLAADLAGARNSLLADEKNLVAMKHTLDSAEADVTRCQNALDYTVITSPIDGIVTRVKAEVGEMVMIGTMNVPGTEIMQVADLDNMLVVAQVDEADVGGVQVGQTARVRMQAYPGRTFEGTVRTVALVQTPPAFGRAKYYEARVLLKTDGQRIFSGLTADVDIETHRHSNVLRIPSQAVLGRRVDDLPPKIRDNLEVEKAKAETTVVYRLIDGKAVVTPVRIGPVDATHSVVLSGLGEADKVIVGPYKVLESLRHEQKVRDERPGGPTGGPEAAAPATQPATQAATQSASR